MSHLTELSDALEQGLIHKDIEKIQQLCDDNNQFILNIKPLVNDQEWNEKIKAFALIHQSATQLIHDTHVEMQRQLYLINQTRKGVGKYKGIKNAE